MSQIKAAAASFLKEFNAKDVTVRLCQSILAVIPFAPAITWHGSLEEIAAELHPGAPEGMVERAQALLETKAFADVIWAAESLDTGDKGISIYTGVKTAFSFFFGDRASAFDTDAQQRADAALKALGLAYMIHRLFDGAVLDKLDRLLVLPAGRSLLVFYGAVEVALPFSKEVLEGGEHFVSNLVQKYATGSAVKLSPVAGAEGVAGAQNALPYLMELLDRVTYHSVTHLDAVVQAAQKYLPKALSSGKDLPGLVATGADAMPVYKLLVGRLAAEAALWQARAELDPSFPGKPLVDLVREALPGAPGTAANPFANPGEAAPPGGDPFAAAPAPTPGDPFAAPGAPGANPFAAEAPAPAPSNPFAAPSAAPSAAAPAAPNPFGASPTPAPAAPTPAVAAPAPKPADPTAAGPGEPLHGSYVRREGGAERWLIFTQEGVFTDSPPATLHPVDWEAHRRAGHQVGRYHRAGGTLTLRLDGGQLFTVKVEERPYVLVVDGAECRMAEFDLSGRPIEGSYRARDRSRTLRFSTDGALSSESGAGRYALGPREIRLEWAGGAAERLPFLSDLKPKSKSPDQIVIGGVSYDRVQS